MKFVYRPEIDGLRAIAVFSVTFYHANFFLLNKSLFSGGFLGVDIFFVISGYLITSIILKEIYKKNNFSFINFYERRVRRIIPALLFVMFCSLPFAYVILNIETIIDFSKSIISSIFFISNIYFNFTGNRYGEEHTLLKPFLHTWSLSVEEQFYILFFIFLILIFKFFKKYLFKKEKYSPSILTGSYELYKRRNKSSFEILDTVQNGNIYRVYPHSYFCDKQIKNRCVSNDEKNIFYYDDDHLSSSGSKFFVDDILKIIKNMQNDEKIKVFTDILKKKY